MSSGICLENLTQGWVGHLVFLPDMNQLKKNLIKRTRAHLMGCPGGLGECGSHGSLLWKKSRSKPQGVLARPKERKLFPWRERHLGKLKITSVILCVRILVTKQKCNKPLGLKSSSIFYKSHNHLQLLVQRKIHMTNLMEHQQYKISYSCQIPMKLFLPAAAVVDNVRQRVHFFPVKNGNRCLSIP